MPVQCDRLSVLSGVFHRKIRIYDRRRWAGRPVPDGGQPVADNSDMDSRRRAVVDHLRAKAAWLSTQWGSYTPGEDIAEPARDNTPAAPPMASKSPEYAVLINHFHVLSRRLLNVLLARMLGIHVLPNGSWS